MSQRQLILGSCMSIALPSEVRFPDESKKLDEKRAQQIRWMRKQGIDLRLKEAERPSTTEKRPLPGTVIYFSRATAALSQ